MFAAFKRIAPRRGWRVFAGEVGIIVLGVLVAVGIGKVVEAIDWHDKVAAAYDTLQTEIVENGRFNLAERIAVTPCLTRQLDRLRAKVLAAERRGARAPVYEVIGSRQVYVHPSRIWDMGNWDSVLADNLPPHMDQGQRETYGLYFDLMRRLEALNREEYLAAAELMSLRESIPLDGRSRLDYLRIIDRETARVNLMALIADQETVELDNAGFVRAGFKTNGRLLNTERWCRQQGLL